MRQADDGDLRAYLREVVAQARQERDQQPLNGVSEGTEAAAVALLQAGDVPSEARRRLEELIRGHPDLRLAAGHYLRQTRPNVPWREAACASAGAAPMQFDLFAAPTEWPAAPTEADPPGTGAVPAGAGVSEDAFLDAVCDIAAGRWADAWQRKTLAVWLQSLDAATLARARVWAEVCRRSLGPER